MFFLTTQLRIFFQRQLKGERENEENIRNWLRTITHTNSTSGSSCSSEAMFRDRGSRILVPFKKNISKLFFSVSYLKCVGDISRLSLS